MSSFRIKALRDRDHERTLPTIIGRYTKCYFVPMSGVHPISYQVQVSFDKDQLSRLPTLTAKKQQMRKVWDDLSVRFIHAVWAIVDEGQRQHDQAMDSIIRGRVN